MNNKKLIHLYPFDVFRLFHMGMLVAYLLGILTAIKAGRQGLPAESSNNATKSIHPKKTPAKECKEVNPSVQSDVPPSPCQRCHAYRSKDNTPKWKKRVEITVHDLLTTAQIGESQKFTLKPEPIKPGNASTAIPFDVPESDSSYTEVRESFEYDDGFKHTMPSSFCTDFIPLHNPDGKWTTMGPKCTPNALRDAIAEKRRIEGMGH